MYIVLCYLIVGFIIASLSIRLNTIKDNIKRQFNISLNYVFLIITIGWLIFLILIIYLSYINWLDGGNNDASEQ